MNETAHSTDHLDLGPILTLHASEPDGYVGFVRKPLKPIYDKEGKPKQFENLCSIQVKELGSMFPAIAHWLFDDSYFTVNSYYRAAPFKSKTTGLPSVWRAEKHLTRLTACYVDIDCGREDSTDPNKRMDWTQALAQCEAMMDADELPQASIIARSGRGIYLFWMLRDDKDPERLPTAHQWRLPSYKAINKALNARLEKRQLPADIKAHDAARVLRVPGSRHSGAKKRVKYWIRVDADGKGFTHTLPELAKAVGIIAPDGSLPDGIESIATKPRHRKIANRGSAPARKNGQIAGAAQRASDLFTIHAWRGGFRKHGEKYDDGFVSHGRKEHLLLLATTLRTAAVSADEALKSLSIMAAGMQPPFPSDKADPSIQAIIDEAYNPKPNLRWTSQKLCDVLGIDGWIAEEQELINIIPDELRAEREAERKSKTRNKITADRREWLRQYTVEHMAPSGGWNGPTALNAYKSGACPEHLAESINNTETARQDLDAIGIQTKRGRRRKAPQ